MNVLLVGDMVLISDYVINVQPIITLYIIYQKINQVNLVKDVYAVHPHT